MTRRDLIVVLGALVLAIGVSAVLYVGSLASDSAAAAVDQRAARPRVFFDFRNTLPAARTVAEAPAQVGPLVAVVPLQRNLSDNARDAAGFLLVVLVTATTLVVAHGRVSIYEQRGEYQMYVTVVHPAGAGLLNLRFEELRGRLEREGLFEPARKRPLPRFPARIGIVTSQRGAVISDMIHILSRRFP